MENIVKIFKLNYDGTFDDVVYADINDVFTIVNILAIYIEKERTMYIWIGKSATQSLMNHITQIRIIIKEEFPEFRILRNITIEMREEPFDFFNKLGISKEDLYKQINHQEEVILPVLEKIKSLELEAIKQRNDEKYVEAIKILGKTVNLAQKIEDEALETEQKRKISEITEKHINPRIIYEIQEDAIKFRSKFYGLLDKEDIIGAHKVIEEFQTKYEKLYDITLNSSANALIKKDKQIWKQEINKIIKNLIQFEKDFKSSLNEKRLVEAGNILEKVKMVISFLSHPLRSKWEEFEEKYLKFKSLAETQYDLQKELEILEKEMQVSLNSFNIPDAYKIIDKANIILSNIEDNNVKKKWSVLKTSIAKAQKKKVLVEQIELLFVKSSDLKEQYRFDELKKIIQDLNLKLQTLENPEYFNKLNILKEEIINAEDTYKKILYDIDEFEKKIEVKRNNGDLIGVLIDCENLMVLLKLINEIELFNKYSRMVYDIKKEIAEKQANIEEQEKNILNLSKLESELEPSLELLDILKANNIMDKAKIILSNIEDDTIKERWTHLEKNLTLAKQKKNLMNDIDLFLPKSSELKKKYKFDEINSFINKSILKLHTLEIPEYLNKLNDLKVEINKAEVSYKQILYDIEKSKDTFQLKRRNNEFKEALLECEKIIKLAKPINENDLVDKYLKISDELKEQKELRNKISKLETNIKNSLESLDISKSNELIEEGNSLVENSIKEDIKKEWENFKIEFSEIKKRKILNEELQDFLKESSSLKQRLLFEVLLSKIDNYLKQLQHIQLPEYIEILENIKQETVYAQRLHENLSKKTEENISKELFESKEEEKPDQIYRPALRKLLSSYYNNGDIRYSIVFGKLQDIIYIYKDLVSMISQIIKDYIKKLIHQFDLNYKKILRDNLERLLLHLPANLINEGVEKLYVDGLITLENFYKNHINYIEKPFLDSLVEVTLEEEENKTTYCIKVNLKLAKATYNLFKDFDNDLDGIAETISKGLRHFQLDVVPKSYKITLNNLFLDCLNEISNELKKLN